jgi:hypothetical protein
VPISDNGPQFASEEFARFSRKCGFLTYNVISPLSSVKIMARVRMPLKQ